MNPGTTKLLIAVQRMVDVIAPEENNHKTSTISGHQLEDLLRATTVLAAPAEAMMALVLATPVAEAAAAGAPHTMLAGELAAAIAGAEATQTATSPVSHAAATMPAAKSKKYVARRPPRQATATVSPLSPLDFATFFSQRNSNLWDHKV
jgi:hypothetical protein